MSVINDDVDGQAIGPLVAWYMSRPIDPYPVRLGLEACRDFLDGRFVVRFDREFWKAAPARVLPFRGMHDPAGN